MNNLIFDAASRLMRVRRGSVIETFRYDQAQKVALVAPQTWRNHEAGRNAFESVDRNDKHGTMGGPFMNCQSH